MTWDSFWTKMKRALRFGAGQAVDGLGEALRFLAPYAVRFILDAAAKRLSATAKREHVLDRLRDQVARAGIRLPKSVLELSLIGEYNRLKMEGLIPGKDPGPLLAALPKIRAALVAAIEPK